jgi:hypothetical protein
MSAAPLFPTRRIITIALSVVRVLLAGEVAVRATGDRLPPGGDWPTPEYARKAEQLHHLADTGGAGIVAFGSSVIDVSLDPTRFPRAAAPRGAYNAGILGTSPSVIAAWARLVVFPALHPDVVLIAVSSRDLNANGVATRGLDAEFANAPEVRRLQAKESFADRVQHAVEQDSQLLAKRQSLRRPMQSYGLWTPDAFALDLNKRGFDQELRNKVYRHDPKLQAYYRSNLLHQFRLSSRELASLEAFVTNLKAQHIRVVLVDVPVTQLYVDLHPRGAADMAAYRAAVRAVVDRTGAELVSFGVWPGDLFADPLHVNGAGARRLTDALGRYLAGTKSAA